MGHDTEFGTISKRVVVSPAHTFVSVNQTW